MVSGVKESKKNRRYRQTHAKQCQEKRSKKFGWTEHNTGNNVNSIISHQSNYHGHNRSI